MSVDGGVDAGGPWPPGNNFVEAATVGNQASDETASYDERVAHRAAECVAEFSREYPELADLPLTTQPGQRLRAELLEETVTEERVEGRHEWEQGFTVERLERADPVTWAEALFRFLVSRQSYDDGLAGRFESPEGELFEVPFEDCWTPAYAERQAARNAGAQRQLMGAEYPDTPESARAGESTEGVWGEVATVLLTTTASSTPGGAAPVELIDGRLPPVDHAVSVAESWNNGSDGMYHVVRNVCEFDLGLSSDRWGYVRGDEPHGMGEEPGANACYSHAHPAVYIDLEATGLRDRGYDDDGIRRLLRSKFYQAIEKHLDLCEYARPEAHRPEESVEVRLGLSEPAAYVTAYLRMNDDAEMMDRAVEFQAWAAVEWSIGRQRIARSKNFTEAAKVDRCLQDTEIGHGGRLTYDRYGNVVCAHCNGGLHIDADTVTEHRLHGPSADGPVGAAETAVADGGVQMGVIGVSIGEPTAAAAVRSEVRWYLDAHGPLESVVGLMGRLQIDPAHREIVEEELAGECSVEEPKAVYGVGTPSGPRHELKAIVQPDGSEEPASSSGGGAEMADVVLPEQRLLRETRLRYHGVRGKPLIKVKAPDGTRFATYHPEQAARLLVDTGVRRPWRAEMALSFGGHEEPPPEFVDPVARPPGY